MTETDIQRLHVTGRVDDSIIRKIPYQRELSSKDIWLFVGYCFHEVDTGYILDIIVDETTEECSIGSKIKLTAIFDEYGRSHKKMPVGYKTICLFKCSHAIPFSIQSLPVVKTWQFNKKGAYLYNHNSIKLPLTTDNNYFFQAFSNMFISQLRKRNASIFIADELEHYFPKSVTPIVIDNLFIAGKIKPGKNKNELVLTDQS